MRRADGDRSLTVKHGAGESRFEQEIELDAETFDSLWPLTVGRRVEKRRALVAAGEHVYEIDVYEGSLSGLAVVEVEFDSDADSSGFEPPEWFGRELTGDGRYANVNLAVGGRPDPHR